MWVEFILDAQAGIKALVNVSRITFIEPLSFPGKTRINFGATEQAYICVDVEHTYEEVKQTLTEGVRNG